MSRVLLCFGGPFDGRVIGIPDRKTSVDAIRPLRPSELRVSSLSDVDPTAEIETRKVTYTIREFGVSWRGDRWTLPFLVTDGYPVDRISYQANVVLALCAWPWPFGPITKSPSSERPSPRKEAR